MTVTGSTAAFTAAEATSTSGRALGSDGMSSEPVSREFRIVTLLPKDAIAAIFDPSFVDAAVADRWFRPDDQVLGVSINGEHRAYGTAFLSSREVVNDTVGGRPIMVTW